MKRFAVAAWLSLAVAASPVIPAYSQGSGHQSHSMHMNADDAVPLEAGQSAFAAIAEIADILANDPETDWSRVDIDALRAHLVDMSELTLNAEVNSVEENGKVIFAVTGTGRTRDAIQRMVPAHAKVLANETDWWASAQLNDTGAMLTIEASGSELEKLRGLGFFGVMATGAHHQAHHLAIARGDMIH
jgi:hypothetical protein